MIELLSNQWTIIGLTAFAVGAVIYVFLMPYLGSERVVEKRRQGAAQGQAKVRTQIAAQQVVQTRRKQVTDTIKDIEARQSKKKRVALRTRIARAGLTVSTNAFYLVSAGLGLVIGLIVLVTGSSPIVVLLAMVGAGLGVPRWLLNHLARRRQQKFLLELANAIDIIVRGVKTGLPLNDCLQVIAAETPEPVRSEFADLVEQQRIGVPIARAFERMYDRVPLPEVNFFAIVVSIQQSTGGNLAEALGNLSQVLRDRHRLAAKVKTYSAEAKTSAWIIASLPIAVMLLVYLSTPKYISLLWTEPAGKVMILVSATWMLLGMLVMRKMIRFDY